MNTTQRGRLAVGAAIGVAALLITSCSASEPTRGDATEECPDGTVTLSVLRVERSIPTDAQMEAYKEINGCIDFDVEEVPFGQFAEKVSVAASSNNPPDIFGHDGPNTQSYASQGILLPLDDYLPAEWFDDVLPATLAEHSWNGSVYSPGVMQDALALFYNKTMLDELGITPPTELSDAWTWDEARAAFEACQVGVGESAEVWGLAPSRLGGGTPGFAYRDLLFLRSAGDPTAPEDSSAYRTFWALSPDSTEVDGWLNTPEAIEAATFFQGLFNGPGAVTSKTGLPNALIDGKACFDIETTQNIGFLTDADLDFEWGLTPLPYFKTPIVHTGAVTLAVSAKTGFPEEAADFIITLSTGDMLRDYAITAKRPPVLMSVADSIPELNEFPMAVFNESIREWGHPRPPSPQFVQYNQYVSDALRDIAYGADPQQALDAAVSSIEPLLNR